MNKLVVYAISVAALSSVTLVPINGKTINLKTMNTLFPQKEDVNFTFLPFIDQNELADAGLEKINYEAIAKAKADAKAKAKEEADAKAKAKEEADAKAKAKEEADAKAKAEAKAKADADAKEEATTNDTANSSQSTVAVTPEPVTPEPVTPTPDPTPQTTTVVEAAPKNSIPMQYEDTSIASQSVLNNVRNKMYSKLGKSTSADLQNAAIARINGSGSNAMDVLASLGGDGWRECSWFETSAYEYALNFEDVVLDDTVNAIYSYLDASYTGYSNAGVGVKVTAENGYYKIKVICVFSN